MRAVLHCLWLWGVLLGVALLATAQWGFTIRTDWDAVFSSIVAVSGILIFMFSLVGWIYTSLRRAFWKGNDQ